MVCEIQFTFVTLILYFRENDNVLFYFMYCPECMYVHALYSKPVLIVEGID